MDSATNLRPNVVSSNFVCCRINGDGNGLCNACSTALVGNESLLGFLRDRTSLELYLNAKYYAGHPFINSLHKKRNNINKNSHFVKASISFLFGREKSSAIYNEAEINLSQFQYSTLLCVLALSSIVEQPIEAYFQMPIHRNLRRMR